MLEPNREVLSRPLRKSGGANESALHRLLKLSRSQESTFAPVTIQESSMKVKSTQLLQDNYCLNPHSIG